MMKGKGLIPFLFHLYTMLEHLKLIIMKEELEMLKKAYNLLSNLFDMGYSYPSSIETLEGLARDIETLKIWEIKKEA